MLELNKIYNMDCLEGMKLLDDECIDLTVTSPPYDNLREYGGFTWDFEAVAKELYRITKQGGAVVWVVGDVTVNGSETGTSFKQALYFKAIGFNLHDTMIYQKDGITFPDSTRYYQIFEYMFVLSKGKPNATKLITDRKNKYAGKKNSTTSREKNGEIKDCHGKLNTKVHSEYGVRTNVWKINRGYMKTTKDVFAYKHPAMFPEVLAQDHILSWSNENDIVLDPFIGSGTTAKMAILNNRNYIGFELSEEYCNISQERINVVKAQVRF